MVTSIRPCWSRSRLAVVLAGVLGVAGGLGLAACSDDDSSAQPDSGVEDGGGVDGSVDPYVLVPPERLLGDVANDCPAAYQTAPAEGQNTDYEASGQLRSFYLQLPDSAAWSGPRPVVVLFNGTGGDGAGFYAGINASDFVDAGFVVVAPDSAGNGTLWPVWDGLREPGHENDPNPDLDYFDSLLACLAAHFELDAKRLYVAGHSAGGIFTNYVLFHRSELLAGGIPASGVFELTWPDPIPVLGSMAVAVTWGGDNDEYSGGTGGVQVPEINFVEQAAIASGYYEAEAAVNQVWCRGNDLGHDWLRQANDWLIDFLLWHPKGLATSSAWAFNQAQAGANYTCGEEAVEYTSSVVVTCGGSTVPNCQTYCQYIGDCAVENDTVAPILGPQLQDFGFSGTNLTDCSGCVANCEADAAAGGAVDEAVLACFETQANEATCSAGIAGAYPFIDASNLCCDGELSSEICTRLCTSINQNTTASALFSACAAWP